MPERLHIETTSFCNLDCEYCVLREQVGKKEVMPFEKFSSLERYFSMVKGVTLSGIAEPLVNKRIVDCVRLIKQVSPDCRVGMFSNAELLDDRVSEGLVSAGLDAFEFSLDGSDAGLVDSIRRGGSLERVVAHVRGLRRIRDTLDASKPNLLATCVLQKRNYRQLPETVDLAADLGVARLNVNGMEPYEEGLVSHALWVPERVPSDLPDILEKALDVARERNLTVRLAGFVPRSATCQAVKTPVILANGDVTACSVLAYARRCFFRLDHDLKPVAVDGQVEARVFGNVFEQSLEDVWQSADYRRFRDAVLSSGFPAACDQCLIKHGFICVRAPRSPRDVIDELRGHIARLEV